MIGTIALMALLLIAGSGGGGGGGGGANSASNNNGWKNLKDDKESNDLVTKYNSEEYKKNPLLVAMNADKAYAELELNGKNPSGDGVVVALGIGNLFDENTFDLKRLFSGVDYNNSLVSGNLYSQQFITGSTNIPYPSIISLDILKSSKTDGNPSAYSSDSSISAQYDIAENKALNSANVISGLRGDVATTPFSTNTHGVAFNAKITQVFYNYSYREFSKIPLMSSYDNVNHINFDLSNFTNTDSSDTIGKSNFYLTYEFENIKSITNTPSVRVYNHLESSNVTSNVTTNADVINKFNEAMSASSKVLMVAPTGVYYSDGTSSTYSDALSTIASKAKATGNLIFVAPITSSGDVAQQIEGASSYRSCSESYLQYCMGAYNDGSLDGYKYLLSGDNQYNGNKFIDASGTKQINLQLAQSAVAGASAVLFGAWGNLTPEQVRDILFESADKPIKALGNTETTIGEKKYNTIYGNGILNLYKAVQNAGPKFFSSGSSPSPSFASGYVIDSNSAITSSPIFGNAFANNVAPQINEAVYFDKYNRDYKAFLGDRFSPNSQTNSFNLNNFAFNNIENKSTSLAFGESKQGQLRFNLSQFKDKNAKNNFGLKYATIDRSVDPVGNLGNNNGFALSYQPSSLSKKLKFGFAFNTDELANSENKDFGTSGFMAQGSSFNSNPYQSFFNSSSINNSSANINTLTTRKFNQAFAKHNLIDDKVALKFSYQTSFENTGQNYSLNGKQQNQALNFGIDLKANNSNKIAITVGELKELDNNMLNSKTTGVFENKGSVRTSFVKIATSQNITDHINLTSTISEGLTRIKGNENGIFRSYDNLQSRSLSVALQYDGISNNKFGVAYSEPMRLYKGKVNYDYAIGIDNNNNVIRKQGSASLTPSGKQKDYEFYYQHNLNKNSQLRLNLMMQKELNNFKSSPTNYVGYLSFGTNF